MKSRMAGILSNAPQAVHHYTRLVAAQMLSQGTEIPRIFLLPDERPALGVVISESCQPPVQWWRDGDGSLVVLDGEIHNARYLQTEPDSGSRTAHDAEMLLDCYRRGGVAALACVDASAGIVIWHQGRAELLILRDPEGAVPVFHATLNGSIIFSNEMTTLLHAGIAREIDLRHSTFS
jgi:asparagine synthetase B (glutamine-hydrolysing)